MCGIAGIFAYRTSAPRPEEEECLKIRDAMQARGPDAAGFRRSDSGACVLEHRRLSIIDLSPSGNQPMGNENQSLWIIVNGEIYNYKRLRNRLERQGHRFRSSSDCEVILHLYEEIGDACWSELEGKFAAALWDEKRQRLVLARDP